MAAQERARLAERQAWGTVTARDRSRQGNQGKFSSPRRPGVRRGLRQGRVRPTPLLVPAGNPFQAGTDRVRGSLARRLLFLETVLVKSAHPTKWGGKGHLTVCQKEDTDGSWMTV